MRVNCYEDLTAVLGEFLPGSRRCVSRYTVQSGCGDGILAFNSPRRSRATVFGL